MDQVPLIPCLLLQVQYIIDATVLIQGRLERLGDSDTFVNHFDRKYEMFVKKKVAENFLHLNIKDHNEKAPETLSLLTAVKAKFGQEEYRIFGRKSAVWSEKLCEIALTTALPMLETIFTGIKDDEEAKSTFNAYIKFRKMLSFLREKGRVLDTWNLYLDTWSIPIKYHILDLESILNSLSVTSTWIWSKPINFRIQIQVRN